MTAALPALGVLIVVGCALWACWHAKKRAVEQARQEGLDAGAAEALRRAVERAQRKRDGGDE